MVRVLFAVSVTLAALLGCEGANAQHDHGGAAEEGRGRCAHCGMRVESNSPWRAGLSAGDRALIFDSPKCMLAELRGARSADAREPWVTEYFSRAAKPAASVFYVLGSDVRGPMGADLIPIEGRERAESFMRDHHGSRILTFEEVTRTIVEDLFRHM